MLNFLVQASFFIAYVVTSGWTSLSSELFRLLPLLYSFIQKIFSKIDIDGFGIPSTPYHSEISRILFFGLLGVTYFFLAPLILPFVLIYYFMGYIVYRNQVGRMYHFYSYKMYFRNFVLLMFSVLLKVDSFAKPCNTQLLIGLWIFLNQVSSGSYQNFWKTVLQNIDQRRMFIL